MPVPRRSWLAGRSTGDLLILLIALTICLAVIAGGGALFILTLRQPDRDVSAGFSAVADVINTLIGLLAGFLAGRTDTHLTIEKGKIEAYREGQARGRGEQTSKESGENLEDPDDVPTELT